MGRWAWAAAVTAVVVLLLGAALGSAQEEPEVTENQVVALPAPQTDGGRPLMQVLKDRQSSRSFSPRPLPEQELSNLLWAAFGVNRPDSGKRTAPSAMDRKTVDVYVATADGFYLFDAQQHALELVKGEDLRALTGMQDFAATAPLNLIYVADYSRMRRASEADRALYSAADTGFISQNVYLYCASEGLGTVVRGMVDRQRLGEAVGLRPDQRIILAQTVGYPPE